MVHVYATLFDRSRLLLEEHNGRPTADQLLISALRQWQRALIEVFWRGRPTVSTQQVSRGDHFINFAYLVKRFTFSPFNPIGWMGRKKSECVPCFRSTKVTQEHFISIHFQHRALWWTFILYIWIIGLSIHLWNCLHFLWNVCHFIFAHCLHFIVCNFTQ